MAPPTGADAVAPPLPTTAPPTATSGGMPRRLPMMTRAASGRDIKLPPKKKKEQKEKQGKKPKPAKKKKDPNKPTAAKTAYLFFSLSERLTVKKAEPRLNAQQVLARVGETWNGLSDTEKDPYVDLAKADALRHKKEMAIYRQKKA